MPKNMGEPKDLPEGIKPDELTAAWNIARGKAERANRNLLQYGGALAGMLGISAGSSGIWAIVKAMPNGCDFLDRFYYCFVGAFCGASIFLGFLFLGLVASFRKRGQYELEAEQYLKKIIALYPERFLPKSGAD